MSFDDLTDEQLVARARTAGERSEANAAFDELYRRCHPRLAAWCLRFCGGDRDAAADLAQEVLLRAHERIASFRGESRFSTWLYTVARRVAINRADSTRRRRTEALADVPEPVDPAADAETVAAREQVLAAFRAAVRDDLEPLEGRVLYLHYVEGMTLPAITELLALDNRSGAKAFIVAGRRKLERRFGPWLRSEGMTW
jgi:RNA polymerase sigma-70 factor (ECF subfamily)